MQVKKTTILLIILITIANVKAITAEENKNGYNEKSIVPVVAKEAEKREFYKNAAVDGTIQTKYSALVSPRIPGIIEDIYVREGDKVEAEKTKLFQIDSVTLVHKVDLAKRKALMAELSLTEKNADLIKAKADLEQAKKDFARDKKLYEEKAISLQRYETSETNVTQKNATYNINNAQVKLAEEEVNSSKTSWAIAEKELRDSLALAPIDGYVTKRSAEPGEMGQPGAPIIKIDNTENLKGVAYLPASLYPFVETNITLVQVKILGKIIGEFPINYKAPSIDAALRTFEIWCDIPGDGKYTVPGAQAVLSVILEKTKGIGVPREALQYRNKKNFVFILDENIAKMQEVEPGLETDAWVEIKNPTFGEGAKIIVQGQFLLENGDKVRERKDKN